MPTKSINSTVVPWAVIVQTGQLERLWIRYQRAKKDDQEHRQDCLRYQHVVCHEEFRGQSQRCV